MRWAPLLLVACGPSDDALTREAEERIEELVTETQTCEVDTDCVVMGLAGSCFDLCWAVVSTANRERIRTEMVNLEADLCADYEGEFIRPPCIPPGTPVCGDDGTCTEAF